MLDEPLPDGPQLPKLLLEHPRIGLEHGRADVAPDPVAATHEIIADMEHGLSVEKQRN